MDYPIVKFFDYKHLKNQDLQDVSGQFFDVAHSMLNDPRVKDGAEKSAGFRKLLEAKDCFVRAALP